MKKMIFSIAILASLPLLAQITNHDGGSTRREERGASPLDHQTIHLDGGTTRAIIIGISDYADDGIPDLQFADRDAESFAVWLLSPAGGSIPAEQVKLLTN